MKTITIQTNPSEGIQYQSKFFSFILFTALFIMGYSSVYSQEKLDTLYGNFDEKQKYISEFEITHLNYKSDFKVQLNGVNSVKYKVLFEFEDFDWHSESPTAFETIFPKIASSVIDNSSLGFRDSSLFIEQTKPEIQYNMNSVINLIEAFQDEVENLSMNQIKDYAILVLDQFPFSEYEKLLDTFQYDVSYAIGLYESIKEFNIQSPNGNYKYAEQLASLKYRYDKLKKENYVRLLKLIISWAEKGPKNYAISDIHFPDKEVTSVKIIILNQFDLTDTICTYSTDIYRTGVFKLDFSTGIGVNSLIKPTYYLGNNGTTSYISKENGRDADLSVMALLHANWRFARNFAFGPVAGVSISTFDANTGFVLGVGSSFGTRNTISISAGGIMGKSYKLSSRVSSNGNTQDIPLESGITDIPKVDALNYGWFVSVTYNLTRTKKKD